MPADAIANGVRRVGAGTISADLARSASRRASSPSC